MVSHAIYTYTIFVTSLELRRADAEAIRLRVRQRWRAHLIASLPARAQEAAQQVAPSKDNSTPFRSGANPRGRSYSSLV